MNNNRLYHLLTDAIGTIENQRSHLAVLQPKADAYDRLGQVLDLATGRANEADRAYAPDILSGLRSATEELYAGFQAEKQAAYNNRPAPRTSPDEEDALFDRAFDLRAAQGEGTLEAQRARATTASADLSGSGQLRDGEL